MQCWIKKLTTFPTISSCTRSPSSTLLPLPQLCPLMRVMTRQSLYQRTAAIILPPSDKNLPCVAAQQCQHVVLQKFNTVRCKEYFIIQKQNTQQITTLLELAEHEKHTQSTDGVLVLIGVVVIVILLNKFILIVPVYPVWRVGF